jgi:hypothetical protein
VHFKKQTDGRTTPTAGRESKCIHTADAWKFKFVLYTLASVFANVKEFFERVFKPDLRPIKTMARLAALLFLMLAASALSQKVLVLTDDTLADALSANEKIMVEFYGASAVQCPVFARQFARHCMHQIERTLWKN